MATFGTTSNAGVSTGGQAGTIVATKYTLSENGTVNKMTIWVPTSGNQKAGIYSDVAGVPTTLLVVNNTGTAVTGGQWNDITLPQTFLFSGTYWLAVLDDTNGMRGFVAGGVNQAAYNISVTYAAGCPGTFPAVSNQNNDYVVYATYSPNTLANNQPHYYKKQGFQ